MEFDQNTIRCFLDDELLWEGEDASLQGYKFGLSAHGSSIFFDNVLVNETK
jgi:hypothetical protein